jgi:hypothetical protein
MKLVAFSVTMPVALLMATISFAQATDNWLDGYQPLSSRQAQSPPEHASVAMAHSSSALTPTTATESTTATSTVTTTAPTETLPPATEYSEPWSPTGSPVESYGGGSQMVYGGVPCDCEPHGICYAEAQILALRAHFGEAAVGKLAEKYEASERIIIGVENPWGVGGRVRYWTYDRTTPVFGGATGSIGFAFDVIDFETTTRFATERYDLVLAAGLRWADIKINVDTGESRNDMPGGTVAADLRALICRDCDYDLDWHTVTGARLSIFGGDWEGGAGGLITPSRDDNITAFEIYGGIEVSTNIYGSTIYTRLLFEAQNWRSDALGRDTGVDSIGFIGPSLTLGVVY